MLKMGVQDVGDFQKAWHIQEVRANGEQIPQACEKPRRLQYRKIGSLGDHMERLLSYFPRNQVHWIFFDDFTNNTEKAYENLLDFLGLPSDGRSDFSVHNPNKQVKSHWFSNFIRTLPKTTPWKLWFWVKEKCNLPDLNFSGFLRSLNTEQKKRDSLSPEFRQHLVEVFRSDIRKLEDLLKTDLSHWARNSDE
jgi:hypothetical protein